MRNFPMINRRSRERFLHGLRGATLCVCLTTVAHGQGPPLQTRSVEELISEVRRGEFAPATLSQLVKAHAVQAIPVLGQQFAAQSNPYLKGALASTLVRLGAREQVYWDFLVKSAMPAIETDAPFPPILLDSEGKPLPGQFTPEFLAWARAHRIDPGAALHAQMYAHPSGVAFLAMTGDPRGRSLLRKALASRNYLVQIRAAKGLARIQDKDSIPLIIAACERVPPAVAELIAHALAFFDDPRAQSAAEKFIPDPHLLQELRTQFREKGPEAVFDGA